MDQKEFTATDAMEMLFGLMFGRSTHKTIGYILKANCPPGIHTTLGTLVLTATAEGLAIEYVHKNMAQAKKFANFVMKKFGTKEVVEETEE